MVILLLYGLTIVVSAILLIVRHRSDIKTYFIKLMLHICLPIVAWFLPLMWSKKNQKESQEQFQSYLDQQFLDLSVNREINHKAIEKDKELNIVPIEEALIISSYTDRRQMLIEVLKQDAMNYIDVLQRAILNPDSETSHYAVSAIMEVKRKLLNSMQELEVNYEKDPDQQNIATAYLQVLLLYSKSGFIDERSKKKYQYTYLKVITRLLPQVDENEELYQAKINMEIELGQLTDAEQTAITYLSTFPLSEKAYIYCIKVYYTLRSEVKLQETLNKLKASPIKLSNEGLKLVRFWSKGVSEYGQKNEVS